MTTDTESEKLYTISEIDDLIKKQVVTFKHTLADAILFLLYADRHPIKGKIKQQKEVFLALKEVMNTLNIQPVKFIKHRYGPYSEEVEDTIDQLVFSNFISVSGDKRTNDFAIEITPDGMEYIKEKFKDVPVDVQERLKAKREEWDTHTTQGILKVVYTYYDEYLEKSVFKDRYKKINWEDENQVD